MDYLIDLIEIQSAINNSEDNENKIDLLNTYINIIKNIDYTNPETPRAKIKCESYLKLKFDNDKDYKYKYIGKTVLKNLLLFFAYNVIFVLLFNLYVKLNLVDSDYLTLHTIYTSLFNGFTLICHTSFK